MSGIQTELKPKGFEVVEAAINENADVAGFIAQYKPPFPVGTAGALPALQYLEWPPDKRPLVPLMVFMGIVAFIWAVLSMISNAFCGRRHSPLRTSWWRTRSAAS